MIFILNKIETREINIEINLFERVYKINKSDIEY